MSYTIIQGRQNRYSLAKQVNQSSYGSTWCAFTFVRWQSKIYRQQYAIVEFHPDDASIAEAQFVTTLRRRLKQSHRSLRIVETISCNGSLYVVIQGSSQSKNSREVSDSVDIQPVTKSPDVDFTNDKPASDTSEVASLIEEDSVYPVQDIPKAENTSASEEENAVFEEASNKQELHNHTSWISMKRTQLKTRRETQRIFTVAVLFALIVILIVVRCSKPHSQSEIHSDLDPVEAIEE